MADLHESKLDAILKAIEASIARIGALENLALGVGISQGAGIPHSIQHIAIDSATTLPPQKNDCSNQNLSGGIPKFRKPRVSLREKFDSIQSKF